MKKQDTFLVKIDFQVENILEQDVNGKYFLKSQRIVGSDLYEQNKFVLEQVEEYLNKINSIEISKPSSDLQVKIIPKVYNVISSKITGLSGIYESDELKERKFNEKLDSTNYELVSNNDFKDFSIILQSLEKYIQKKTTASFRQISKAFYERTRNFCKLNNISDDGFTMTDWKELFSGQKIEIMKKYGLFINSVGNVMYLDVGKFNKPINLSQDK